MSAGALKARHAAAQRVGGAAQASRTAVVGASGEEKPEDETWFEGLCAWERTRLMVPLQRLHAAPLSLVMHALGEACTGDGLVVLFALLNWCVNNRMGTEGIWLVPVSEITNGLLKWAFRAPRPSWVSDDIVQGGKSNEYSFPSSHAMISFSLAVYFAAATASPLPYVLAAMVAFSRVYEGMHYPHDVVIGAGLGATLGAGLLVVLDVADQTRFTETVDARTRIGFGTAAVVAVLALIAVRYREVRQHSVRAEWRRRVHVDGRPELDPHFAPLQLYVSMGGVLLGLTVAETTFAPFPMPASAAAAGLRFVAGTAVLLFFFFGLRAVEKAKGVPPAVALALRFARFAQVPPIILLVGPPLFEALGV